MSRRAARLLLVAACVALAGCGAAPGVRDEGNVQARVAVPDASAPMQSVDVFLVQYGHLTAVSRRVRGGQSLARAALLALLQGPTAAERSLRMASALPKGSNLADLRVSPTGDATVELIGSGLVDLVQTQDLTYGPSARQRQFLLEQVVYTLTQFAAISYVDVTMNGQPIALVGFARGQPLTREIFGSLAPRRPDTACAPETPTKVPPRPNELHLTKPRAGTAIAGGVLDFAGESTVTAGTLVVRLVQDGHVLGGIEAEQAQYNVRGQSGVRPCTHFSGTFEVPWGASGAATLHLEVTPGAAGGAPVVLERPVVLQSG
jgi:hypothetical protein